jgi:thymidylate kinase
MCWDKRHGKILSTICSRFTEDNIKYFILRNYEGLPYANPSKDVDIIVDPVYLKKAKNILKQVYQENKITYYFEVRFAYLHCCHGIDINTKFGIHLDIIGSYVSKGSEIFTFDELYSYTENYNNFRVLNKYFEGVMVFIYKQFNYKPILKEEYKEIIYNTHNAYPEFKNLISKLVGNKLANNIFLEIEQKQFDRMLSYSKDLTKALRKYALKKQPFKTFKFTLHFFWEKLNRLVFFYRKHSKVFSVMAPDGAGKTTFLDALIEKIEFFFVCDKKDNKCNLYHFRPNILPNLGELGEKAGIMEQDTDFTNPQRAKPANKLSSLIRIAYYWLDYVIGFNILVRKDVQYDKFSVFDRYSYDLLVDPGRTRLNLPMWLRKLFVKCMPHPKVVFYLDASPEIIFKRKQELTLKEITRQTTAYRKLAFSNKRFISLNANRPVNESVDDAIKIILETFTVKL